MRVLYINLMYPGAEHFYNISFLYTTKLNAACHNVLYNEYFFEYIQVGCVHIGL